MNDPARAIDVTKIGQHLSLDVSNADLNVKLAVHVPVASGHGQLRVCVVGDRRVVQIVVEQVQIADAVRLEQHVHQVRVVVEQVAVRELVERCVHRQEKRVGSVGVQCVS